MTHPEPGSVGVWDPQVLSDYDYDTPLPLLMPGVALDNLWESQKLRLLSAQGPPATGGQQSPRDPRARAWPARAVPDPTAYAMSLTAQDPIAQYWGLDRKLSQTVSDPANSPDLVTLASQ